MFFQGYTGDSINTQVLKKDADGLCQLSQAALCLFEEVKCCLFVFLQFVSVKEKAKRDLNNVPLDRFVTKQPTACARAAPTKLVLVPTKMQLRCMFGAVIVVISWQKERWRKSCSQS